MQEKILIVDDSPKNIQVVANFLQNEGYDLSFATDGKEALHILGKDSFDLILLDVVMPEVDGFEICRKINSNSSLRDIPILFLTVKTDPDSIIKGFESGGLDYITKPFNPYELLARIKTHLRLRSIQNQFRENNKKLIEEISLREKVQKQMKNLNAELEYKVKDRTKHIYKLAGIIDQLYEDVIITDKNGRIEYVNKSFEKNSGFEADEVIGDIPRFMEKGKYSEGFYDELWSNIRSGKTWQVTFTNHKKDKMPYEEQVTVIPIMNHGNEPEGFFSLKRDVSVEKNLEKQLFNAQKMEAIGTLAGGIAHDFNNILTAILGYSEIAKMELTSENVSCSRIDEVIQASKRAKDLVKQILLLSRRADVESRPVRVDLIAGEAVKLIRSSIPSSIEVKYHFEETIGTVMADPIQIHQVIMNLCTNAYQAIEGGKGYISLDLREETVSEEEASRFGIVPGEYLKLSVEDNGKGVGQNSADKIFEPYFTTKESGQGTGLGLAIVNGIMTELKGTVFFTSEKGITVFRAFFPYHKDVSIDEENEKIEDLKGSGKIIFVDDEVRIAELGKIILESLGYSVENFNSGVQALERIESSGSDYDILITDLTMPEMSGIELAAAAEKIKPDLPVILISGFKKDENGRMNEIENIKKFVAKPFSKYELGIAVKEVLGGQINNAENS